VKYRKEILTLIELLQTENQVMGSKEPTTKTKISKGFRFKKYKDGSIPLIEREDFVETWIHTQFVAKKC
jgi:hypothetical protein